MDHQVKKASSMYVLCLPPELALVWTLELRLIGILVCISVLEEFEAFGLSFLVFMIFEKHWPHQHKAVLEFKTVHLIIPVTRPVQSALLR
ncbi:hypothetical protein JRO89_XS15G0185600 [Xanthoceras sorbifolium]|uniref:Uncharacterized protein n=1 Tax=Xanthoceras sorbifolium TaxID=99658 RepID=A0ABQ8H301_9ROSI|nr:hypothetical protein JRO89_XS15G0185600 [Xanthoceras sorbifolium]